MKTHNLIACGMLLAVSLSAHAELTIIDESKVAPKISIVPIKPIPIWTLTAGATVGHELQSWGEKAGWKVIWNMQKDWSVPASTKFEGEFPVVAAEVIKTLASNGALIRAQFFEGNKTMVVTGPGVSE